MANLYEIDYQLQMLEDYMVDVETGEILDEDSFNAKFDEIQMALNEKIESSICFVKNLQADIEAFKTEEKMVPHGLQSHVMLVLNDLKNLV